MDFDLTDVQKDIRKASREFAKGELTEVTVGMRRQGGISTTPVEEGCDLGFVGVFIKEEYGGANLGFTEAALVMEEFWRVDPGCGNILLAAFGAEIIQQFGTEERRRSTSLLFRAAGQ